MYHTFLEIELIYLTKIRNSRIFLIGIGRSCHSCSAQFEFPCSVLTLLSGFICGTHIHFIECQIAKLSLKYLNTSCAPSLSKISMSQVMTHLIKN